MFTDVNDYPVGLQIKDHPVGIHHYESSAWDTNFQFWGNKTRFDGDT